MGEGVHVYLRIAVECERRRYSRLRCPKIKFPRQGEIVQARIRGKDSENSSQPLNEIRPRVDLAEQPTAVRFSMHSRKSTCDTGNILINSRYRVRRISHAQNYDKS